MNCVVCHSKTSKFKVTCKYCHKTICSIPCKESHMKTFHSNIISNSQFLLQEQQTKSYNDQFLNSSFEKNNKISPYYIKGVLIPGKISYDHTFSLKNFVPVIEHGKPKIIGNGSFGQVYLALNKIDRKYYAIKHMEKDILHKSLKSLKGIYEEIDIQSRINHPNIVRLFFVKETEHSFDLVMENANGGNLFFYIRQRGCLSEQHSFLFFIQIVNAVYFLHNHNIIHRDIKPENILIFNNYTVKLCDFGWCTKYDGTERITFCGTTEYMAPEMVKKESYNKEIDVWSLGILLYELVHGYSPFKPNKTNFKPSEVIGNIIVHNLKFKKEVSEECKELIYHLLDENIEQRYKVEDIFNSKFVKYYEEKNFGFPECLISDNYFNYISDNNSNYNVRMKPRAESPDNYKNSSKITKKCAVQWEDFKLTHNKSEKSFDDKNLKVININNNKEEGKNRGVQIYNNTTRNFYPNDIGQKREKELIEIYKQENENQIKRRPQCKVKKIVESSEINNIKEIINDDNYNTNSNKFYNINGITEAYIKKSVAKDHKFKHKRGNTPNTKFNYENNYSTSRNVDVKENYNQIQNQNNINGIESNDNSLDNHTINSFKHKKNKGDYCQTTRRPLSTSKFNPKNRYNNPINKISNNSNLIYTKTNLMQVMTKSRSKSKRINNDRNNMNNNNINIINNINNINNLNNINNNFNKENYVYSKIKIEDENNFSKKNSELTNLVIPKNYIINGENSTKHNVIETEKYNIFKNINRSRKKSSAYLSSNNTYDALEKIINKENNISIKNDYNGYYEARNEIDSTPKKIVDTLRVNPKELIGIFQREKKSFAKKSRDEKQSHN